MTQAGVKKTVTAHLFGPNGELCVGSVEFIIANLIGEGVVTLVLQQALQNVENSIIHYTMSQIFAVLADYAVYNVPFAIAFFDKQGVFAAIKHQVSSGIAQESGEMVVNG